MSRDELAARMNAWLHAETGKIFALDERAVGRWERGAVRTPSAPYRAALRAVLQVDHDWALGLADPPLPAATAAPPLGDPPGIAAMRTMAESFQAADRRLGGGQLYAAVLAYLQAEVGRAVFAAREGVAVFAAAASLTEAVGWMAHDCGRDAAAREHFGSAYRLAVAADSAVLAANICASMSHLAGHLGQVDEAVRLAEVGLVRLDPVPGAGQVAARLHAMRAKSLAMRGDRAACVHGLDAAERALAGDNDHEHTMWSAYFDGGSLAAEAADALHRLGDLAGATRRAREAISLRGGDRVRALAFGRLALAGISVDAGRIDDAEQLGHEVCTAATGLTSARVLDRLDQLVSRLGRGRDRTPSALVSQVDALRTGAHRGSGAPWPI